MCINIDVLGLGIAAPSKEIQPGPTHYDDIQYVLHIRRDINHGDIEIRERVKGIISVTRIIIYHEQDFKIYRNISPSDIVQYHETIGTIYDRTSSTEQYRIRMAINMGVHGLFIID